MKKFLATFLMMAMLFIAVPLASNAQTRNERRTRRQYSTSNDERPNFYRRHRNAVNIGVGTGAGALIGAIAGGKKGAGIGALVGAGASALYTYKINKKKTQY